MTGRGIFYYDGERGSGNTTRCIDAAIDAVSRGHSVLVVTYHQMMCTYIIDRIAEKMAHQKIECEKIAIQNMVRGGDDGVVRVVAVDGIQHLRGMRFNQIHIDVMGVDVNLDRVLPVLYWG